jgi:hypothetical protein
MGELRIELYEKYCSNSDEEIDQYEQMGMVLKPTYRYRRINPLISDILYIREVEDIKDETIIVFKSLVKGREGHSTIVLGSYDDIWIKINDLENSIEDED